VAGQPLDIALWSPAPYAELRLHLDGLGATFGVIIAGTALCASLFGSQYAHHSRTDDAAYPLFILSMLLVVSAANVYSFLVFWEAMALTSFILVLGDGTPRPRRHAAIAYLLMTHTASAFAIAALFLIANGSSGSTEFASMMAPSSTSAASLAFLFAVVGFGTKAGLVPLHVWLPRAHPVAPSHVSAVMSAAMVTTGIYGLTRVTFDFLGPGEVWWGLLLMGFGSVSAVLGVLYALMERDMKRVLAYSTVENVGIICIGLGAAVALRADGEQQLAAAALLAALVHAMNHAWFKTLLFLAAGSIQRAAHTLNLDLAGGLARRMPLTGAATLVGSLAIAGLPPLNGFAGEWLLLRGLTSAISSEASDIARLVAAGSLAALALTSGLAVACFVRFYGIGFLGLPRSENVAAAKESGALMYGVLGVLALGCVVTGLSAPYIAEWLDAVPREVIASSVAGVRARHEIALETGGSLSPALIGAALIMLAPLPWLLARLFFGHVGRQAGPIWATGVRFGPAMQYTATSFSKPVRLFFRQVLLPERSIDVTYHGASRVPRLVKYSGRVPALFEERLYQPVRNLSLWASSRLRLLQSGSAQTYLLYMMVPLVILVVLSR
jgi:hydrogenase-4 component B